MKHFNEGGCSGRCIFEEYLKESLACKIWSCPSQFLSIQILSCEIEHQMMLLAWHKCWLWSGSGLNSLREIILQKNICQGRRWEWCLEVYIRNISRLSHNLDQLISNGKFMTVFTFSINFVCIYCDVDTIFSRCQ